MTKEQEMYIERMREGGMDPRMIEVQIRTFETGKRSAEDAAIVQGIQLEESGLFTPEEIRQYQELQLRVLPILHNGGSYPWTSEESDLNRRVARYMMGQFDRIMLDAECGTGVFLDTSKKAKEPTLQ